MARLSSRFIVPWAGAAVAVVVFATACWDEPQSPLGGEEGGFAALFTAAAPTSLESPVRLSTTPSGELLVTDSRAPGVLTVNPATLVPEQVLEINGKPLGVALMSGRMYVGNGSTGTVEIYDGRGRRRGSLEPVEKPTDLATDESENWIFVLNAGRSVIQVFDRQGRRVTEISGPGTAPDQLLLPMGIAVDPGRREVYVTDYGDMDDGNASIKIFDYDGQFLGIISGRGNCGMLGCSGGFSRPQGIAVDGQGQIFVVDALLSQVLVFDRATLKLVRTIGDRTVLRRPLDVVIGGTDLFVTSSGGGAVVAFRGAVMP